MADAVFDRILLKLSGEALMGSLEYGTDPERVERIASQIPRRARARGRDRDRRRRRQHLPRAAGAAAGMDRATADYMGMLATVLNALTLQDALEKHGSHTRVMSAIQVTEVAEPYIRRRAIRHLEKGRIVIFAAGTGNPFFTTDTAASLRALEIHAEAILMAKHGVEGVYDADPAHPDAKFLPEITHREAIERGLKIMDSTALSLCMDNALPIYVFNMADESNIDRIVHGERVGTIVCGTVRRLGSGQDRRACRTRLIDELLDDAEERMDEVGGVLPQRARDRPHRPRLAAPARPHHRRLLRRRDAAQPALQRRRDRRAPAHAHALRQERRSAAIEKAIMESDLGLTPHNDGNVIRLQIPELNEERRREMVKVVHGVGEEGKIAIRNVRRDVITTFAS